MGRRYALRDDQWERVFRTLATDANNEYALLDSTIVRAHQHSAGAKGGTQPARRSDAAKADPVRRSMLHAMRWATRPAFT